MPLCGPKSCFTQDGKAILSQRSIPKVSRCTSSAEDGTKKATVNKHYQQSQALVSALMMIVKRAVANTVLVVSSLTLVACGSLGGGPQSDFKGRIYGGAGLLISKLEPENNGVTEFSVDETQSGGGSVVIGYDVMPRISVEGHYSALGEATFTPDGSIDYQVAGLSALVYGLNDERDRARREGFSIYGRLGGGFLQNDAELVPFEQVNEFHLLAGIGAEYGLSNGLAVRLEGVSHDLDAQYVQAALIYRIGESGSRRSRPATQRAPVTPAPTPATIPAETDSTSSLVITDATPLDSDADGVVDTADQCNDTLAGTPVGADGCTYFDGAIEGVVFDSGSDVLTLEARSILGEVVDVLNQYPQTRITIGAHTDNQGSGESNLMLSKQRAIAVTRFLVEQGIDGSRLAPRAYGESQPRQSNDTAEGRAANRRVEFNLL